MNSLIGFFIKVGFSPRLTGQAGMDLADSFNQYLLGENGIDSLCKRFTPAKYGNDVDLILFECHLKPSRSEVEIFKDKISFRRKEKSIGIPIILDDKNFFGQPSELKSSILKKELIDRLTLLDALVKSKKIDLDITRLKADFSDALK